MGGGEGWPTPGSPARPPSPNPRTWDAYGGGVGPKGGKWDKEEEGVGCHTRVGNGGLLL